MLLDLGFGRSLQQPRFMAGIRKPFQDQPGVVLSRPGVVEEAEAPGCQLRDLEGVGA